MKYLIYYLDGSVDTFEGNDMHLDGEFFTITKSDDGLEGRPKFHMIAAINKSAVKSLKVIDLNK